MTKTLISLALLLLILPACSGRQKRVCNQNAAYQHGYQAAQKGDSVENASTNEAAVCQDFEAYSPTLYRSDFKAGYFKGKKEYCSDFNYKRWGQEDGNSGKEQFPNNYSDAMKICLQDPEYKKKAAKLYGKSFNEAFCNEDRMTSAGQKQAKNFQALKTPSIKKRCGKASGKLISAMRRSYKEQMKTNCTTSFWLLKGEEDAKAKKSKSLEISKAQKCSASVRDKLITNYSRSYNERKALLIEEEKLAFEKQAQKERMEMEQRRQDREYELEKEKIGVVRDSININSGGGHSNSGGSQPYGRPHVFYHKGGRISVTCHVNSSQREARIDVENQSNRSISMSGYWKIYYYDRSGRKIKTNSEHEIMILSSRERETFDDRFVPFDAYRCAARFTK